MTPQQEAVRILKQLHPKDTGYKDLFLAKRCAHIALKLAQRACPVSEIGYWENVEAEIDKLSISDLNLPTSKIEHKSLSIYCPTFEDQVKVLQHLDPTLTPINRPDMVIIQDGDRVGFTHLSDCDGYEYTAKEYLTEQKH